jgi:hypothetical protein
VLANYTFNRTVPGGGAPQIHMNLWQVRACAGCARVLACGGRWACHCAWHELNGNAWVDPALRVLVRVRGMCLCRGVALCAQVYICV